MVNYKWWIIGVLIGFFLPVTIGQPLDWQDLQMESVVESVQIQGKLEEEIGRFEMEIGIRSFKDKWVSIPLFPNFCSVLETETLQGDSKWVYLLREKQGYKILLGKPDYYQLKIRFVTHVQKKSDKSFLFKLPQLDATHSTAKITIPQKDVRFTLTPNVTKSVENLEDQTVLTLYGEGPTPIEVEYSLEAQPEELKPIINANQLSLYYVDRQILRLRAEVEFALLQGTVDLQKFEIPKSLTLLNLSGANVKTWYMKEEGNKNILVVNFAKKLEKKFNLQLDLEQVLPEVPSSFSIPSITPLGVERESGFIGISTKKGLRVEALEMKQISKIDPKELPQLQGKDIHLGFKYLNKPFSLKVSAQEVIPKVEAQINTKVLVLKDSLKSYTYVDFNVKDAGVFQFKLELPEDLKPVGSAEGYRFNGQTWVRETINVQDPVITEKNTTLLTVDLRSKIEGKFRIVLRSTSRLQNQNEVKMPMIRALDVVEEVGYLGVASISDFKVELANRNSINQININYLPDELRTHQEPGTRETLFLAFRDNKLPFDVSINISKVQPEVTSKVQTLVTVKEKEMLFATDVIYDIQKAGIFSVELKVPKALLAQLNVSDNPQIEYTYPSLEEEKLLVTLKSKTEGTFVLRFTSEIAITDIEKGLQIPAIQTSNVKKEEGYIALELKTSIRFKAGQKFTNLRDIDIQDLPPELQAKASKIAIAYRYFKHPFDLNLAVERIVPRVSSDTFHFMKVNKDLMDVKATIGYEILYAGVSTFKFELPPQAINVNVVDNDHIKHKDEDKKTHIWTITTFSERTDKFQVEVTFQYDLSKTPGNLNFHGVKVLDVERATGYLAISADKEIELKKPEILELTPLDEKELPPTFTQTIKTPILLAFRYLTDTYDITLHFDQHKAAEVLVAVIEGMKLHSVLNQQGKVDTRILLYLKNTKEQYLRIQLPEGAKIMPAYVNGEEVVPSYDSADPSTTLINIGQSKQENVPLLIHLQYIEDQGELGSFGSLNLVCPRVKIPVLRVGWTLNLPEGFRLLKDEGGTMKRVYTFDPYLETQTFDFNQFSYRYRGRGNRQNLPGPLTQTGNRVHFQQLIPLEDASTIELTYTKDNFKETLEGTLIVLMMAAFALGIYLQLRGNLLITLAFGLSLFFLAMRTLNGKAYFELTTTLVYGMASLGVLWSIYFLGKNYYATIQTYRANLRESVEKRREEALLRKYPADPTPTTWDAPNTSTPPKPSGDSTGNTPPNSPENNS